MKILVLDDELIALTAMLDMVRSAVPSAEVEGFQYAFDALDWAREAVPDIAFLDIETPDMSGIELAKHLKDINAKINIVFATGYARYRGDAFDMYASGYLLKPVTEEKVRAELEHLRHEVSDGKIFLRAFGNFEAFLDGVPLNFGYDKSKELLAYLVFRRGACCTLAEAEVVLFEEEEGHASYLKRIARDLMSTLEDVGHESIITREPGKLTLHIDRISCDYLDYLEGDEKAASAYYGEFMDQYSWAEPARALLDRDFAY